MYSPLRWELSRKFPGYRVTQHNSIMDVLGGYSKDMAKRVGEAGNTESGRLPTANAENSPSQAPCISQDLSRYVLNNVDSLGHFRVWMARGF